MSDFWKLLVFFWTNRKQLPSLLEALPDVLEAVGISMQAAGTGAVEASRYVRGDSTGVVNARSALNTGANVIDGIKSQVNNVKVGIDTLAAQPHMFLVQQELLTLSGLVQDASDEVEKMGDALTDASSALDSTGTNLKTLGLKLKSAGGQLRQFA